MNALLKSTLGLLVVGVVAVNGVGIIVGVSQLVFADAIYPGVEVWGADLSGLTRSQAADVLSQYITYPQTSSVILRDGEDQWVATPGQLGVQFELANTIETAFAFGRSGDLLQDLNDQWQAWYRGESVSPCSLLVRH